MGTQALRPDADHPWPSLRRQTHKRKTPRGLVSTGFATLALFSVPLLAGAPAHLRGGDGFEIVAHVVAGGGVSAAGGGCFSLDGTVGQPVAGRTAGGDFVVETGFWMLAPRDQIIFRNGFESGDCPP